MLQNAAAIDSRNTARVLLIDDDEIVSGALFHQLQSIGIDADVAVDGAFGRQLLLTYGYSLIVVDPYLTGHLHDDAVALLASVRALQPHARIIVLSAYGTQFGRMAVSDANLRIVAKPASVLTMTAMIEQLLNVQQMV